MRNYGPGASRAMSREESLAIYEDPDCFKVSSL